MKQLLMLLLWVLLSTPLVAADRGLPNIILIVADDLGYGELGCYGQQRIQTPHLDQLANEGMRFTQAYCGTSVCAPSRCSLLTGLHSGHTPIRANRPAPPEGQMPLPAGTVTIAKLLQQAGYSTACIGKWGLGGPGSPGTPDKQGFDHFYGYLCQTKAHNYWPQYLWRDGTKVPLEGKSYSHDLIMSDAIDWISAHQQKPFFLFLSLTIPHIKLQEPDLGQYADAPLPPRERQRAAAVSRMDRDIGRLRELLRKLKADQQTLLVFTSDNGPDIESPDLQCAGPLRGIKRSMYEGGLRIPLIACWPGHIQPAGICDQPAAFWDMFPTFAGLSNTPVPGGLDGISLLPALQGKPLPARPYLYWELHEGAFVQALRQDQWKLVRNRPETPELYNLENDPAEQTNVAGREPEILQRLLNLMDVARTDCAEFPVCYSTGDDRKPE